MKRKINYLLVACLVLLSSCGNNYGVITSTSNENDNVKNEADVKASHVSTTTPYEDSWDSTMTEKIIFKAKDLDGKDFTSEDLFRNNKLTLVNFWGTTCPPCIYEMPELEKLNKDLKEKECGVIGIITDGDIYPDDAKELIKSTGVTYPNVCLNQEIYNLLPIQVTPTTFFIDSEGNVIGEPVYGARNAEMYMGEIENHLKLLKS